MKLHYVYYAIQKNGEPKVGVTSNVNNRFRYYLSSNLLEVHTDPKIAGDREIELQIKYFGKRDSNAHYIESLQMIKNRNIDYNNRNIDYSNRSIYAPKGEERLNTKLTDKLVLQIRKEYTPYKVTQQYLAEKYKIHFQTIQQIISRKTWNHI